MTLLSRFLILASLALTLVSQAAALHARRPSVIGGLFVRARAVTSGKASAVDGCCQIGTNCCSGTLEHGPLCLSFSSSLSICFGNGCCPTTTYCDGDECCPLGELCSGDSGQCAISTYDNCPDGDGCCASASDGATDAEGTCCRGEGGGGGSPTTKATTTTKKITTTPTAKPTTTTHEIETTEHNSSPTVTHTVGGNSGDDTPIPTPTKSAPKTSSTGFVSFSFHHALY
ncbi:hypothetical protein B0H19DRAFT_1258046 [Mycena capillaripes]|nr:hypothetical protein B0H19DRAFT_1258046 [Mycena capillaripes]